MESQYITMRDGVQLAVDVYLPWEDSENTVDACPTIVHLTRYYRRFSVYWPFSLLLGDHMNMRSIKYIEKFVPEGYVWVTVDVRGTGASYGNRPIDFSDPEIEDYKEIFKWVSEQEWCDGNIGSTGISYDGMASVVLASVSQEVDIDAKVKAIAPICSPMDLYRDLGAPGGIISPGFLKDYTKYTTALEQGKLADILDLKLPFYVKALFKMMKGVSPVTDDDQGWKSVSEALVDHQQNWDMWKFVQQYDQLTTDSTIYDQYTIMDLGPLAHLKNLKDKVSVYAFGAYYDTKSVESALRIQDATNGKLTIGPWTHGGRRNSDPYSETTTTCFDLFSELVRFFDHHLKGKMNGIETEADIHYFTIGSAQWKPAGNWPPAHEKKVLNFDRGNKLTESEVSYEVEFDQHEVFLQSKTVEISRWNLIYHVFAPIQYPDRAKEDEKLLYFETNKLEQNLTITGTIQLEFYVEVSNKHADFFVYIGDVDQEGSSIYVTEGQLRAEFRKPHGSEYQHTFLMEDYQEINDREIMKINIALIDISWMFVEGHSIRVSIAGSDTDNFEVRDELARFWKVYRGKDYQSKLILPVESKHIF
eukprot:TRINITY_DN7211_c0_g1_i1.p2 TRINITY_DN7211_c0_g1~~TRINITY_DN7211_c0_g1_i1.p2  ORF type:complete len:588 (-),score=135.92 TRINITY_DN7211_c0_g1_i1:207-1970(-)